MTRVWGCASPAQNVRRVVTNVGVLPKGRAGLASVPLNGEMGAAGVANAIAELSDLPLLTRGKVDLLYTRSLVESRA